MLSCLTGRRSRRLAGAGREDCALSGFSRPLAAQTLACLLAQLRERYLAISARVYCTVPVVGLAHSAGRGPYVEIPGEVLRVVSTSRAGIRSGNSVSSMSSQAEDELRKG